LTRFKNWKQPKIKDRKPTKWGWVVWHPENLTLGIMTDIGYGTFINAQEGVEIGDRCQFGPYCVITSANTINNRYGKIKIMRHALVGSFTLILPCVTIGEGAKIGAHCIITKDVMGMQKIEPYTKW